LPHGYKAQALIPWGTPITGSYPAFDSASTGNTGEEQEQQVGSHHDGMHYFPMPDDPNGHGLLCVNHEYVDQRVLHVAGPTFVAGQRPTDEVRKEIAAHGVSVVEIKKSERRLGGGQRCLQPPRHRRHADGDPRPGARQRPGQDQVQPERHHGPRHHQQLRAWLHALGHLPDLRGELGGLLRQPRAGRARKRL
jgi:hypothetical protein